MKYIFTFLIALCATVAFGQQSVLEDFEGTPTLEGFEGLGSAAIEAAHAVNQVRVFNIAGQEVLRAAPHAATFKLDTSDLKHGVYMLSLQVGNTEVTKKLVK